MDEIVDYLMQQFKDAYQLKNREAAGKRNRKGEKRASHLFKLNYFSAQEQNGRAIYLVACTLVISKQFFVFYLLLSVCIA